MTAKNETIAVVTITADGVAKISGANIAVDRNKILRGLENAVSWLNSHTDERAAPAGVR